MLETGRTDKRRRRSGIGTVVATVVFVFLFIYMMGQLNVWYLNQLDDYNAVSDRMRELDAKRLDEKISISAASILASNQLTLTVVNNGGSTAHLISLWIIDESVTPNTHSQSNVDVFISSGGSSTVTAAATYGNILTIRLVTELGNIASHRIAPASAIPNLRKTLTASPPSVIGRHDVDIALYVFNNRTDYNSVYDLRITPASDISYSYTGTGESITLTTPDITTISSLRSGETALFGWHYTINLAAPGQNFTFRGKYTGASSFASDVVQVVTPFGREQATSVPDVLGSVRVIFGSMQWANRQPDTQTSGFTWNSNWQVSKDDYLVFRMNITNDSTENVALNQNTAIYMQDLKGTHYQPFYIVSYSGGTISTYAGNVVLLANSANTATVYFAVDSAGGNPTSRKQKFDNDSTFIGIVGIFGNKGTSPYGQTVPFQGFRAT